MAYKFRANGYKLTGDIRSGLKATVTYIMPWSEAFIFIDQILPAPRAGPLGNITWRPPASLNLNINGIVHNLYADSFTCDPCGSNGLTSTQGGLAPGDFYSHAIFTVQFGAPTSIQQTGDDQSGANQLDPENPITACEQSVNVISKMQTRKGAMYKYDSTGKPVPGDIPILVNEVKVVLKFPRIPLLPFQLILPYCGKINNSSIFQMVKGSLLLEGMVTIATPGTDGSIAQNLGLSFAFNTDSNSSAKGLDWNAFPLPDGTGTSLIADSTGGGTRPYSYVEFRDIFQGLQF